MANRWRFVELASLKRARTANVPCIEASRVDPSGAVSFAGTSYRAGNRYIGEMVGVRIVADTVQITRDGLLLRTHKARHDKDKEFGALSKPGGRPRRRTQDVA